MKFKRVAWIISLFILGFSFLFLLRPIITSSSLPGWVIDAYKSMGVESLDMITPLIVKIFIIGVIITILALVWLNKKNLENLLKPKIKEGIVVFLALIFWYLFNDALNIQAGSNLGIYQIGIIFGNYGVPVLDFIFISFFGSLIMGLILIFRKEWDGHGKDHKLDNIFRYLLIFSYIVMGIVVYFQLYGGICGACDIPLVGITRGTLYHIGVVGFISSLFYYLITE